MRSYTVNIPSGYKIHLLFLPKNSDLLMKHHHHRSHCISWVWNLKTDIGWEFYRKVIRQIKSVLSINHEYCSKSEPLDLINTTYFVVKRKLLVVRNGFHLKLKLIRLIRCLFILYKCRFAQYYFKHMVTHSLSLPLSPPLSLSPSFSLSVTSFFIYFSNQGIHLSLCIK